MIVQYTVADGIARIMLNRPEKRNALNAEMIRGLREAFDQSAVNATVRVIVLEGAGADFCAGLDLKSTAQTDESDVMEHLESARSLADLFVAMRRNPKVIVSAVRGRAIGGGCGLATASDLILVSESAEFRYPEVNLGFVAAIVLPLLRRQVSEKRAFEIVACGASISAEDAFAFGIANQVFEDDEFDGEVESYVAKLAVKSASALSLTKDLLYHIDGMSFEAAIHAGLYTNAIARMTPDARQGFERFVSQSEARAKT
ncbi:MAG: enoyl-CoA hydratase/isomerase family protein [Acidobacteriota bacterium]